MVEALLLCNQTVIYILVAWYRVKHRDNFTFTYIKFIYSSSIVILLPSFNS